MENIERERIAIDYVAQAYIAQAENMFAKGEAITSILLRKKGHTSNSPLEFGANGMNGVKCPTTIAINSKGEYSYCYIIKIWVDEDDDKVYCDLYDYDQAEDLECVCLSQDKNTKWETIIKYLI